MAANPEGLDPVARRVFRIAVSAALLASLATAALGLFRQAFALTLGGAVAIVSAVWLSDLTRRVLAPRLRTGGSQHWGFFSRALLRYAVVGLTIFVAVRLVPGELPWLLGGLSTVVAAIAIEGIWEAVLGTNQRGKLPGGKLGGDAGDD